MKIDKRENIYTLRENEIVDNYIFDSSVI